jgi:hypothetical protein
MARTRRLQYDPTVGVRLNTEDRLKLQQLCLATQLPVSEVLRMLVRLAEPTNIPPVEFRIKQQIVAHGDRSHD